jgi:predicted metal-dependent hydrolase
MASRVDLGGMAVDVVFKDIKNVHLRVYPPDGKVRISAPARMSLDTLRVFAISKLAWIRQRQKKLREQARETPREFLDRESHCLWGTRYLLKVVEEDAAPTVALKPGTMFLKVRPGTSEETKQVIVSRWYRQQIRAAVPELIAKWEPILGVRVERIFVQRMKTRWGSCNTGLTHGPSEHGAGQETEGVPRVHLRPRTGASAGAASHRTLHRIDGRKPAAVATAQEPAECGSARVRILELLTAAGELSPCRASRPPPRGYPRGAPGSRLVRLLQPSGRNSPGSLSFRSPARPRSSPRIAASRAAGSHIRPGCRCRARH